MKLIAGMGPVKAFRIEIADSVFAKSPRPAPCVDLGNLEIPTADVNTNDALVKVLDTGDRGYGSISGTAVVLATGALVGGLIGYLAGRRRD